MAQAPSLAPAVRANGKRFGLSGSQPLSIHPNAFPAALASETALEQESSGKWTTGCSPTRPLLAEAHERWARELGMDLDIFWRALRERKLARRVTDDSSLDSGIGAGGAPTSFINGERVLGAVPFEQLKTIVDRQLGRSPRR